MARVPPRGSAPMSATRRKPRRPAGWRIPWANDDSRSPRHGKTHSGASLRLCFMETRFAITRGTVSCREPARRARSRRPWPAGIPCRAPFPTPAARCPPACRHRSAAGPSPWPAAPSARSFSRRSASSGKVTASRPKWMRGASSPGPERDHQRFLKTLQLETRRRQLHRHAGLPQQRGP